MPRTGAVKDTQCQMQTQSDRGNSENGHAVRPVLWNPVYLAHQRAARPYPKRLHEDHSQLLAMLTRKLYAAATPRRICYGETELGSKTLTPIHPAMTKGRAEGVSTVWHKLSRGF